MLPTLEKLQIGVDGPLKRQKMDDELEPCHDELRYEDGEIVNLNSDRRVRGASCKFLRNAPFSLETVLTTYDDMIALNPLMSYNWETVLRVAPWVAALSFWSRAREARFPNCMTRLH